MSILISQLPKNVQEAAKNALADAKEDGQEFTAKEARIVLGTIKKKLTSRGIPLNAGCKKFDIASIAPAQEVTQSKELCGKEDCVKEQGAANAIHTTGNARRHMSSGSGTLRRGKPPIKCYICERPGHIAKECTYQFCQRCGVKGHGKQDCKNNVINKVAI